jgi:hypothetical protein
MGAAGKLGTLPGAKPHKINCQEARRASFTATAATRGKAENKKIAPVARPQVRRPDVGRTALAAIGKHPNTQQEVDLFRKARSTKGGVVE